MYLNKVAAVGTATHKFASLARRLVDEIKATERAAGGFWETMAAPLQTARIVTSLLGKLFELDEDSLTLMLGSADISTARAAFERMRASGRGTESLVGEWLSVLIAPTSLRRRTWQNN